MVSDADEYAWVKGGEAANQSTDEQIEEAKETGEMSDAERVAHDVRASILLILRSYPTCSLSCSGAGILVFPPRGPVTGTEEALAGVVQA